MTDLTEEQWNTMCDRAEEAILKTIADLPERVQRKASEWECFLEKHSPRSTDTYKVLGICAMKYNAIVVYVADIFEQAHGDLEKAMPEVRRVYLHELAHAIGQLVEWEVQARGL